MPIDSIDPSKGSEAPILRGIAKGREGLIANRAAAADKVAAENKEAALVIPQSFQLTDITAASIFQFSANIADTVIGTQYDLEQVVPVVYAG
jgi:hypothetical protein